MIPKIFGIVSRIFAKTFRYNFYRKSLDVALKTKKMKLVIVTAVEEFQKDVLKLFKKANIENFSSSEIDGYKNGSSVLMASSWFPGEKFGNESRLFFSFTEDKNIDTLFNVIKEFNTNLETNNPIKAIVVPIEKFI